MAAGARAGYTIDEIVWLRSIDHAHAVEDDEGVKSSWPSGDDGTGGASAGDTPLPVVVRWREVDAAVHRVVTEKRDQEILKLRAAGETEEAVAAKVKLDQSTVNRRLRATLEEIQAALGGPPIIRQALSIVPPCIKCGERPRARAYSLRRTMRSYWQAVEPERELSHCAVCLPVESRERLLLRTKDLVQVRKSRITKASR